MKMLSSRRMRLAAFLFQAGVLASLLVLLFLTLAPVRRHILYPLLWQAAGKICLSDGVRRVRVVTPSGAVLVIDVEEGQRDRLEETTSELEDAIPVVEYYWGPFERPIPVRLSNGIVLFDKYQTDYLNLPGATTLNGTLLLFHTPNTEEASDPNPDVVEAARAKRVRMLAHELTHMRMYELYSVDDTSWYRWDVPRWFTEGMGVYAEGTEPKTLLRKVRAFHDRYPNVDLADDGTAYFNRSSSIAYRVSYELFLELVNEHGRSGIQQLFMRLRTGESFDDAFAHTFGERRSTFEARATAQMLTPPPAWKRELQDLAQNVEPYRQMCLDAPENPITGERFDPEPDIRRMIYENCEMMRQQLVAAKTQIDDERQADAWDHPPEDKIELDLPEQLDRDRFRVFPTSDLAWNKMANESDPNFLTDLDAIDWTFLDQPTPLYAP